jgi:hypothetical protein
MRWTMPSSAQLSIGTTASRIAASNGSPIEVHLHCSSGNVYLDGSGVTSSTGYRMDNGQVLTVTLADHEELWGVTSTGTSTLYVLVSVL